MLRFILRILLRHYTCNKLSSVTVSFYYIENQTNFFIFFVCNNCLLFKKFVNGLRPRTCIIRLWLLHTVALLYTVCTVAYEYLVAPPVPRAPPNHRLGTCTLSLVHHIAH